MSAARILGITGLIAAGLLLALLLRAYAGPAMTLALDVIAFCF